LKNPPAKKIRGWGLPALRVPDRKGGGANPKFFSHLRRFEKPCGKIGQKNKSCPTERRPNAPGYAKRKKSQRPQDERPLGKDNPRGGLKDTKRASKNNSNANGRTRGGKTENLGKTGAETSDLVSGANECFKKTYNHSERDNKTRPR